MRTQAEVVSDLTERALSVQKSQGMAGAAVAAGAVGAADMSKSQREGREQREAAGAASVARAGSEAEAGAGRGVFFSGWPGFGCIRS